MVPTEPLEIGHEPQFFVDDWVIDNRWGERDAENVVRRFHQPVKHAGNPLISGTGGYVNVLRDPDTGRFEMWYQTHVYVPDESGQIPRIPLYGVAYARSQDGIEWELPDLGVCDWPGQERNVVWMGADGERASGPHILDVPEDARRGHRHVMAYKGTGGQHLVCSDDGIHWDPATNMHIAHMHSDTHNTIVRDEARGQYIWFCRAKDRYNDGETRRDAGRPRRIARMTSPELWTDWLADERRPQMILVPDELDLARGTNFFYGMPVMRHAGIFWGFLWPFRMNTDIQVEPAFSRDGLHFERLPNRPLLVELGGGDAWDRGMVFGGARWVEVGDEWWYYYAGFDGPHSGHGLTAGMGLTRVRREGLVSLRGPEGGGVIVTRRLRWPGGGLVINADAAGGEIEVRVADWARRPIEGLDYADCATFTGDSVAHEVTWGGRSLRDLAGEVIRLEIAIRGADIWTFRAAVD